MHAKAREEPAAGFTIPDGAALVLGAAVAALHLRDSGGDDPARSGVTLLWLTFAGVALTAAGPFVYLVRRRALKVPGYPGSWDRLWLLLGLPWALTAALRLGGGGGAGHLGPYGLYVPALVIGTASATMLTLAYLWRDWIGRPPPPPQPGGMPWTARLGMLLSVSWPVQWGLVLTVAAP